jgi:uncharacterized membrane protein YdjX (TVP38/TMEM64 family)
VVFFSVLEPFGFPSFVLIATAVITWPLPVAFLLAWLGAIGAGLVAFTLARMIGRDWVESRMPARLLAYDERLAERPFRTVILVRLIFFLLPLAHWFLGLSRVRLAPFVVGSAIGFLPGLAVTVFAGESILAWLLEQPTWMWWVLGAVVAAAFLAHRLRARSRVVPPAVVAPLERIPLVDVPVIPRGGEES